MSRRTADGPADDTRVVRGDATSDPPRAAIVRVASGPDTGREAAVEFDGCLVGSGPAATLRLSDPTVSRRHVTLRPASGGVQVVDHGSRNETRVGGVRLVEGRVPFGMPIAIGETTLVVSEASAPAIQSATPRRARLGRLIGASPAMQALYDRLEKIGQTGITVLIEGETGTGKELVAETIHEVSAASKGPFVVMDCTTMPPTLMESELFGHERGAFTGATSTKAGLLEAAENGTLFVDEIAELDVLLQPKLLRAIERREFRRVGATTTSRSNARVISATRRDLDAEVLAGRFRDDLFHRLAVARVVVPPLRDREGDVTLLANEFAEEFAPGTSLPADVLARFEASRWPGNVRELRNAVARFVALGEMTTDAPRPSAPQAENALAHAVADGAPYTLARDRLLAEFDRAYVEAMLERHGGNVSQAARAAGIGRRYFHVLKARIDRE